MYNNYNSVTKIWERVKTQKKPNLKIGVIGLGSVGSSLKYACDFYFEDVIGYDINGDFDWKPIIDCDVVFICVPTSGGNDGRLDCSCVEDVLSRLDKDSYSGVAVIKSTLRVGFMSATIKLHPKLRLVYCPEFLREKSSFQWTVNPDRIVLAGAPNDVEKLRSVFVWVENAKIILTDYRSAEVGKLAHNAYIATKVSFTNEIERMAHELGANVDHVMDIVVSDRRVISKEHLTPHLGPYGGKCVPKDTTELKNSAGSSILLDAVEKVNEQTKQRYTNQNS